MAVYDFTGKYSCALDSKNRVNIPAGIRKMFSSEAENTLVFAPGFDSPSLDAYPLNEWQQLTKKLRKLNPLEKNTRMFIRSFVGDAHTATMDGQGRIMIPERILKLAGIEHDMLMIGALNKFEIWNPEIYERFCSDPDFSVESQSPFDLAKLAEGISARGVSLADMLTE